MADAITAVLSQWPEIEVVEHPVTDGGAAAVEALGYDVAALDQPPQKATTPGFGLDARLAKVDIVVECDVDNPLTGP